ncbi:MAG: sigma 54-interacting transcriptional regulator [Bradymonadia bacterium]
MSDYLVCRSPVMVKLATRIRRYAATTEPVLITGPSGSGKEHVARALHGLSDRKQMSLLAVNCAAIPPSLLESELFGTQVGAFTGAKQRAGWFERAHQGTLFLDEIGDMPTAAQTRLLRVLETGLVWPIGAERPKRVDVRIICATHQALMKQISAGHFRLDLFHRISTLQLKMPPLRQRRPDLKTLAHDLSANVAARLTASAWTKLEMHHWPGNVRELRNVLIRAGIENLSCPISEEYIAFDNTCTDSSGDDMARSQAPGRVRVNPLRQTIHQHITQALKLHDGNIRATARALGVSPTTVYKYISMERITFATHHETPTVSCEAYR